jgi:hypoxanthine phosphoribosyltransferase
MKQTTQFGIAFSLWSWDDLERTTIELADQIEATGREYDRIIALANGGMTMVRLLGDRLGTNKISCVQLSFYQGINDTKKEPQIIQPLTTKVSGQKILIFEDIVDTGATLEFALSYLRDHGVASVETASMVVKPHSSIQPQFAGVTEKSWVIFPYETRETLVELWEKWKDEHGVEATREALLNIGFSPSDFAQFCH